MIYFYVIYLFFFSTMVLILSIILFMNDQGLVYEWLIMSLNSMNMEFLIYLDWLSLLFMSIVMIISLMILIYSVMYMEGSKNFLRYLHLVLLFIFSMIMMILSPNLISIMFGWDGLGLVSFSLVVFYQNYVSYNSGMLTVLVNRLGDIMILMVIGMMMMYGSWNMFMIKKMKILMFLLMIAGMTKSAQIPFSSWLPSAMVAPTPVSALVHSSTLVTAGVYLMIRFSSFLMVNKMNSILLFFSVLTMFMSGLMANFEYDLKKIIALSTLSQLGLMMMILSIGFPLLAFYHLLTHAIFKSLLFMSAGMVIHLMNNNQDIRYMGSLSEFIPFTLMSFKLTLMALCGFPFFSGFYSKDLIMEIIYSHKINFFLMLMSLISLMFTIMYSIRLLYYVFFKEMKNINLMMMYESKNMMLSMITLMILSVMIGSLLNWMFFIENYIILNMKVKLMTMMMIFMGMMMIYMFKFINLMKIYYLMYFLSSMWYLNYFYMYLVEPMVKFSNNMWNQDQVWMEYYSIQFFIQIINGNKISLMKFKMLMMILLIMLMLMIMYM